MDHNMICTALPPSGLLLHSTTAFILPFSTVCQHLQSIQSINLM